MMEFNQSCWNFCRIVAIALFSQSCSSALDTTTFLTVKMLGVLVAPEESTGDHDPVWQEYTLEGVFVSPDPDTGDALSLYTGEPESYKIIDRPQILFKREIDSSWIDETFDSLVVRFSTTVTAAGKYKDDYTLELAESDIGNYDGFTVEKGQGIEATVKVQWKNTVTRNEDADPPSEDWIVPTFDVSISLD